MEYDKENLNPTIDSPYIRLLSRGNRVPLQEFRHEEHLDNHQELTEEQMDDVLENMLAPRVGRMAWNHLHFEDDNLQAEINEEADQDIFDGFWAREEVHQQGDQQLLQIERDEVDGIWLDILNQRIGQHAQIPRGEQALVQEQPAEEEDEQDVIVRNVLAELFGRRADYQIVEDNAEEQMSEEE